MVGRLATLIVRNKLHTRGSIPTFCWDLLPTLNLGIHSSMVPPLSHLVSPVILQPLDVHDFPCACSNHYDIAMYAIIVPWPCLPFIPILGAILFYNVGPQGTDQLVKFDQLKKTISRFSASCWSDVPHVAWLAFQLIYSYYPNVCCLSHHVPLLQAPSIGHWLIMTIQRFAEKARISPLKPPLTYRSFPLAPKPGVRFGGFLK